MPIEYAQAMDLNVRTLDGSVFVSQVTRAA